MTKSLITVLLLSRLCCFVSSSDVTQSLRGNNKDAESPAKSYLDPKTIAHKLEPSVAGAIATADRQQKSRRKFISYTSSYFEKLWLEHIEEWENGKKICEVLLDQQATLIHDWLDLACTQRYERPSQWCIIDDAYHPVWYNRANRDEFDLRWAEPDFLSDVALCEAKPIIPTKEVEHVLSKYVFLDETTGEEYYEYIEPLVSHLRFPLAKCLSVAEEHKHLPTTFKGWIIPPPPQTRANRVLYFDIGSSSWNSTTGGGAAVKYFTPVWQRQSIEFDEIYAFDAETSVTKFYQEYPAADQQHTKVHFQQCTVSGSQKYGSDLHPFVPNLIHCVAELDDYVLLKLDIDMPDVEQAIIDFILQNPESPITELVWEHHISGNYLMEEHWGQLETLDQASMYDSYKYFLQLRQKGIRAHSWV